MVHHRAAADNFSDNIHDIHSRWQADFFFKLVRIPAALGFSWTIMFFSCVWFLLQGDDGEDIHSEASNVATWWGHPCYGLLL